MPNDELRAARAILGWSAVGAVVLTTTILFLVFA